MARKKKQTYVTGQKFVADNPKFMEIHDMAGYAEMINSMDDGIRTLAMTKGKVMREMVAILEECYPGLEKYTFFVMTTAGKPPTITIGSKRYEEEGK